MRATLIPKRHAPTVVVTLVLNKPLQSPASLCLYGGHCLGALRALNIIVESRLCTEGRNRLSFN